MRVSYLYPAKEGPTGMGTLVRRRGIVDGLRSNGHEVREVPLRGGSYLRKAPELLTCIGAGTDFVRSHVEATSDALLIEGAPLALALAPRLRHIESRVHIDVCDSWRILSAMDVGDSWVRQVAKRGLAELSIRTLSRLDASVSYISERDAKADALASAYSSRPRTLVVPNASHESGQRLPALDPKGPFVVLGDFAYGPNRQMLAEVRAWVVQNGLPRSDVRIVGPNLDHEPDWGTALGWVPELADAFEGASCLIAPVRAGAGVNNKVLDALALDFPVVATPEALNGISPDPRVLSCNDLPEVGLLRAHASAVLEGRKASTSEQLVRFTWRQATSQLASCLRGNRREGKS